MANYFRVLGQIAPPANNANVVYTVASGRQAVVSTINICNQDAAARAFRVAVVSNAVSGTLTSNNYIAYETPIQANDSMALTLGVTMMGNDYIVVQANSTANMSFSIFGSEIY
jgi:hypothetical protein